MTRPTVLDMALVVVPQTMTPEMIAAAWAAWHSRHGGKIGPGPAFGEAVPAAISASPYPTAWDDVRRYVEGLETEAETLRGWVDPSVMELMSVKALSARIAELEKRLADAERVIERVPQYLTDMYKAICNGTETAATGFAEKDELVRAARAYMEGK